MGVTLTPGNFETALKFLTRHYTPVSLEAVLADSDGRGLPPRPILVTFDDGYASAMNSAALCHQLSVPAVFFLNAAFLDNHRLAPDNLVCYAANAIGLGIINHAARAVRGAASPRMRSMVDVFQSFFPDLSLLEREAFLDALTSLGRISERDLAKEAALYLTRKQLFDLASLGFEIGNHTYTHVHCRSLRGRHFMQEIDRNKTELEAGSGAKIRSFSLPYGSSADLTGSLAAHLRLSGHEAVFLSESVANPPDVNTFHLDRISPRAKSDEGFFFEIEVMPRLRAIRSRVRAHKEHRVN
jgi:peptidoglycan/xylan/chitin deacetylase (PgdA/CDA1 family)